jgi:hypothetical protein
MRGTLIIGPASRVAAFPMAAPANVIEDTTARITVLAQLFAAVPKHSPRFDRHLCAARTRIANTGFIANRVNHILD